MKAKYTANWGVQVVGMVFQTRLACLILYVYIYISYVLAGWCMRELYAKLIFFLKRVKNALKNRFECTEHLC